MYGLPLLRNNMAAAVARTAVKIPIKPHVPLIKFPSRGPAPKAEERVAAAGKATPASTVASAPKQAPASTVKGVTIDASELPQKYRRKPLSNEEMEIIEKGGQV